MFGEVMVLKRISMLTWVDLEEVMDSVIRSFTESMVIPSPLTQDSSATTDTTNSPPHRPDTSTDAASYSS